MVALQKAFDDARRTTFAWSARVTREDTAPLSHNVLSLAGEVGELANDLKKYERGDFGYQELLRRMPSEIADIQIYLVKLCYQSGIDLERAFLDKLKENERRFPLERDSDDKEVNDEIESIAGELISADPSLPDALVPIYANASVALPPHSSSQVVGAVLALTLVDTYTTGGDPEMRRHLFDRLERVADRNGLKWDQVVRLTRHEKDLRLSILSGASAK